MRGLPILGILGLLVALSAGDLISRADAAGAIAIGRCDRYGYSYGYPSEGQAKRRALRECQSDGSSCQVVVTLHGACGAFAVDGPGGCGARGWAYAPSRGRAERVALNACARYGGRNCRVRAWVCDGGP